MTSEGDALTMTIFAAPMVLLYLLGVAFAWLAARRDQPLSHDNVFHSVLGMLDIDTAVLNPRLDLFHACVRNS